MKCLVFLFLLFNKSMLNSENLQSKNRFFCKASLTPLIQIDGFDVKRVDEYHLTGIVLDMFVKWEQRPPTSTEGRGENRNESKAEGASKPEQKKSDDTRHTEGLVSFHS